MKHLSNSLHYAVELLSVMQTVNKNKKEAKPVSLREVVELNEEMPLHFLEQIARKLRIAGILDVVRGPGGGYVISKPCDSITVGSLLKAEIQRKKGGDTKKQPPFKISKSLEKAYENQIASFMDMPVTEISGFGSSKIRRK